MRPETHLCVLAINAAHNGNQSTLEVTHSDTLVYYKTLKLVEERGVSRIDCIGAVNAAGRDNADRRLLLLHGTNLYGGGL